MFSPLILPNNPPAFPQTSGNTALHIAAARGLAELFPLLLEKGADPKALNVVGMVPELMMINPQPLREAIRMHQLSSAESAQ